MTQELQTWSASSMAPRLLVFNAIENRGGDECRSSLKAINFVVLTEVWQLFFNKSFSDVASLWLISKSPKKLIFFCVLILLWRSRYTEVLILISEKLQVPLLTHFYLTPFPVFQWPNFYMGEGFPMDISPTLELF